jgi:alpha/beta superfamily hydrolase
MTSDMLIRCSWCREYKDHSEVGSISGFSLSAWICKGCAKRGKKLIREEQKRKRKEAAKND